jgi:hypothetical protein
MIKCSLLSSLLMLCFAMITGCSKKKNEPELSNVAAIVSQFDWYHLTYNNDLKMYQGRIEKGSVEDEDHDLVNVPIDEMIDKKSIAEAQVLVYTSRVDMSVGTYPRTFFRLPYTQGTKKISFSSKEGALTLTSNFDIFTPDVEDYYFCFIILPKGYRLPDNINLDNFDQVATYFKIDKKFLLTA